MSYQTEVKAVGMSFRHVKEELKVGDKVKLVPEPDNKYDPNALSIQTVDGEMLGYVGKKDKLRTKMLAKARNEGVVLPVLVANYHKEGEEKLWESVEEGDLVQLWLRATSRTPVDDDSFRLVESFTGDKVLWSEYLHMCTDQFGKELVGGSTYASMNEKPFDSERIAKAYAKKNELETEDVLSYWDSLGTISADYGTAIHGALEHYSKNYKVFGHEASLPRVPHLREAVEQFLKVSDFENCIAEPLVTDTEKGMSGWIDNLRRYNDTKIVTIEDYKTNTFKEGDYEKKWAGKLETYQRQGNYYGTILENHGYTIDGLVIWHWHEGKWNKHEFKYNQVKEYAR